MLRRELSKRGMAKEVKKAAEEMKEATEKVTWLEAKILATIES